MLGFSSASRVTKGSYFGKVSNEFSFDDMNCTGSESNLTACEHEAYDNCNGYEGAGLKCV